MFLLLGVTSEVAAQLLHFKHKLQCEGQAGVDFNNSFEPSCFNYKVQAVPGEGKVELSLLSSLWSLVGYIHEIWLELRRFF